MKRWSKGKKILLIVSTVLTLLILVAVALYLNLQNFTVQRAVMPDGY